MQRTEWTLGADDAGRRLDRILRRLLAENSQGAIEAALRKGLVRLNGKKTAANAVTNEGDVLSCADFLLCPSAPPQKAVHGQAPVQAASQKSAPAAKSERCPYPIVFQNEHLLFIDKSAGVPVHGQGSVAEFFASQKTDSLSFVCAPLHRLDKGTSGLLAVSKSLSGARWFCEKIRTHEIKKFYWGIICGRLESEEEWSDELESGGKKKAARTLSTPLKRGAIDGREITLVQFQIFTGRKRQIRIQSAARGRPILGDVRFGGFRAGNKVLEGAGGDGFFLRAMRLEFPPNDLGLPPAIEAPLPKDFLAFFKE